MSADLAGMNGAAMLKANVQLGKVYIAKVSGKLCRVRLARASEYGGWMATNLETGREIRIRSAAKLRREVLETVPS